MKLRSMSALVVTSGLVLATAACGSSDEPGSGASSGATRAGGMPDLSGTSLTFAGFGGVLQDSQETAWFEPFDAATGAKSQQAAATTDAAVELQIKSGNVQWDVTEVGQFGADSQCGKLYEPIPDVDLSEIDPEFVTNECGVPAVKFSFVLAYNSKKYPTPPTSIGDIVDTKTFPGKRGLSTSVDTGPIEAALLGDGVAADGLYPLDYERGIEKLDTIKEDIAFKETFAQMQDELVSGNIDMGLLPNGRAFDAAKANPDVKVVWGDALTLFDNLVVIKGAPNEDAAKAFLAYVAKADTQAALSKQVPYGILTSGAPPVLPPEQEAFFPDSPDNASKLLYQDQEWWAENQNAVETAYTAFTTG